MRFDAPEHIETWVRTQRYPAIHDDIFTAVQTFSNGTRVLDLCCSTGLLAQRIQQKLKMLAVGVDADAKALKLGRQAGIVPPLIELKIDGADSFDALGEIVRMNAVDVVVARRCMPELFGHDQELGRLFAAHLYQWGIKEIFIEGRVATKNATNPLANLKDEVALFTKFYKPARAHKNVSMLVAK